MRSSPEYTEVVCSTSKARTIARPRIQITSISSIVSSSGGPIFRVSEGQYTLVGITSRAVPFAQIDPSMQCGGGGIYTIVGRETVHNWLRANGVQSETTVAAWVA